MEYSLIDENDVKRVAFYGNIKASSRHKILEIAKAMTGSDKKEWVLDVHEFDYIDSSGLGMMIELQEEAVSKGITLTITGAKPMVRRMFDLSKFDRLFKIVD